MKEEAIIREFCTYILFKKTNITYLKYYCCCYSRLSSISLFLAGLKDGYKTRRIPFSHFHKLQQKMKSLHMFFGIPKKKKNFFSPFTLWNLLREMPKKKERIYYDIFYTFFSSIDKLLTKVPAAKVVRTHKYKKNCANPMMPSSAGIFIFFFHWACKNLL